MTKDISKFGADLVKLENRVFEDLEKDLNASAHVGKNQSKRLCPVDEGSLRASIDTEVVSATEILVGTPLSIHNINEDGYAEYVEFGTSKMGARPYLRPGVAKGQKHFNKRAKKSIDKAVKDILGAKED